MVQILSIFALIIIAFTSACKLEFKFDGQDADHDTIRCSSCDDHGDKPTASCPNADQNNVMAEEFFNISTTNSQKIHEINEGIASIVETQRSFEESFAMINDSLLEILSLVQDLVQPHAHNESKKSSDAPSDDDISHLFLDGVHWSRFWWYNGTTGRGWPAGETDVLGASFGTCRSNSYYCFGRLPAALKEDKSELLAVDSVGAAYRWKFDSGNPTAHAAWNAFYNHKDQRVYNSREWAPKVISGTAPKATQDSFMYRVQNGVRSLLLDDDNCDCYTTLSMGHGMCNAGFSTSYGPANRFGVDLLHDPHCETPAPQNGLTLYFRDDDCQIGGN